MLNLSASQCDALDRAAELRFRQRMVRHVQYCFPHQCPPADAADFAVRINRQIDTAVAMGITARRDICRYLNLIMTAGGLDTELQTLAWAADIIARTALSARARLLLLERALAEQ